MAGIEMSPRAGKIPKIGYLIKKFSDFFLIFDIYPPTLKVTFLMFPQ